MMNLKENTELIKEAIAGAEQEMSRIVNELAERTGLKIVDIRCKLDRGQVVYFDLDMRL